MNSVQFIHGENGEAIFAVMPIAVYRDLVAGRSALEPAAQTHPLVNEDQTMIKLPYGGLNAYLHVPDLVNYLQKHGIKHLAINQRAQVYTAYPENQLMTLDPIIRREFIDDLRYKNTMQATTEVIDALVSTGKFRRCKQRYEGVFTRAVNAIELVD
ncbi:hypothetical protein GWQ44_09330 [Pseudomonas sp. 3MA1]|uniref:hypothetical protein n=1 Tax=Pseudomonas sp. 3MA1 TaxID=2699196 RepID=UPI0005B30A3C|nr:MULTISPECIES: hypothetical protein [Pseudomonas]MCO7610567.1 hypothetical protein [Pseudomonas chlororaphis]MDF2395740.1 hypothetical protein [Pseudomonas sp. 3MA1]